MLALTTVCALTVTRYIVWREEEGRRRGGNKREEIGRRGGKEEGGGREEHSIMQVNVAWARGNRLKY